MSQVAPLFDSTQQAILSAFRREDLRRILLSCLGEYFDELVADKALDAQVTELLLRLDSRGQVGALLRCLGSERPENRELAELAAIAQQRQEQVGPDQPIYRATQRLRTQSPLQRPLQRPLRTQHFTGRAAELAKLLADLQDGRTVTLCGPGGIGKSSLAAEAVWTLFPGDGACPQFPDGVLFHTFYHQPQADLALEAIARAFGVDPRPTPRDAARQALAGRRALLVLDGAEAADDLPAVLAVTGSCAVLITTRRHADAPGDYQDVEPLPRQESLQLLAAWGGKYAANEDAANEIVRLVGGLPLALFLAGRYLAQRQQRAQEYAAWLGEQGLSALHFGDRPTRSVPLLLAQNLGQVSAAAQAAFGVAGLLALAPFDARTVAAGLEAEPVDKRSWWHSWLPQKPAQHPPRLNIAQVLGELVDYGLLLRPDDRYQVTHALAHAYARRQTAPAAETVRRLALYYATMAEIQTRQGPAGFAALDEQRAHIVAVQTAALQGRQWDIVRELAWKANDYLDLQGHLTDRLAVMQTGVEAACAVGDQYDAIAFQNALGLTYADLGQPHRAIELYEQALATARLLGARRDEGAALGNLGAACAALGEQRRAIDLYDQQLVIAREIGDRGGESAALGNLGVAFKNLDEPRHAIELFGQQLILTRQLGDRRREGSALGNLGNAYKKLGDLRRAIEYQEQYLTIAREIGDRQGEAFACWNLGLAYKNEGDLLQAVHYMQVCVAYEQEIGHPDAAADARRVADLQRQLLQRSGGQGEGAPA